MKKGYPAPAESRTLEMVRCEGCNKLLAERLSSPWQITCPRCSHTNARPRPKPGSNGSAGAQ